MFGSLFRANAGFVSEPAQPENVFYSAKTTARLITVKFSASASIDLKVANESAFLPNPAGCLPAKLSTSNGVQNQPVLNLNQPASCFSLIPTSRAVAWKEISVGIAEPIKSVIQVIRWPAQTISSFKLSSVPFSTQQSVPMVFFVFSTVLVVSFRILKSTRDFYAKQKFGFNQPTNLFAVMRC